jgi:GNAT superfamily N-acetyltransferase
MSRVRYLLAEARANGVLAALDLLWVSLFKRNVFQVLALDLSTPRPAIAPRAGIEVRLITIAELRELRSQTGTLSIDFSGDELFGYTHPFVAFVDNQVAAIMWIVLPGQPSRFLDLQEGEVEINYLAVRPEFRGQRLGQHVMAHQVQWAAAANHRRMFVVVDAQNIASLKPMLDLGFRPVEALVHIAWHRPKAQLRHA